LNNEKEKAVKISGSSPAASTEKTATGSVKKPAAEQAKGRLKITGSKTVKIYSSPNPFSSVIKKVSSGRSFDWYDKDQGGWYKIHISNGPGWVYEEYVEIIK
jgi:hypothetical protein